MARVTQISVSLDGTVRFADATDHGHLTPRNFRLAVTLRADCEHGAIIEQIGRLQAVARRAIANERDHLLRQEDYARTEVQSAGEGRPEY